MRIHGHFHKLAKLYVSELLFSFIFCPPTFVFLQTIFFSYKAVLIMFGAISALPVNIQRSYTNLLFILFDFVDNAVRVIYKSDGIISASITYIICIWGISTVIYFIQNHFYKHQPQMLP